MRSRRPSEPSSSDSASLALSLERRSLYRSLRESNAEFQSLVSHIHATLRTTPLYWRLRRSVKDEVVRPGFANVSGPRHTHGAVVHENKREAKGEQDSKNEERRDLEAEGEEKNKKEDAEAKDEQKSIGSGSMSQRDQASSSLSWKALTQSEAGHALRGMVGVVLDRLQRVLGVPYEAYLDPSSGSGSEYIGRGRELEPESDDEDAPMLASSHRSTAAHVLTSLVPPVGTYAGSQSSRERESRFGMRSRNQQGGRVAMGSQRDEERENESIPPLLRAMIQRFRRIPSLDPGVAWHALSAVQLLSLEAAKSESEVDSHALAMSRSLRFSQHGDSGILAAVHALRGQSDTSHPLVNPVEVLRWFASRRNSLSGSYHRKRGDNSSDESSSMLKQHIDGLSSDELILAMMSDVRRRWKSYHGVLPGALRNTPARGTVHLPFETSTERLASPFGSMLESLQAASQQLAHELCGRIVEAANERKILLATPRTAHSEFLRTAREEKFGKYGLGRPKKQYDSDDSDSEPSEGVFSSGYGGLSSQSWSKQPLEPTVNDFTPRIPVLFDAQILYRILRDLKSPNRTPGKNIGSIPVAFRTYSIEELREKYEDLHPSRRQLGLDEDGMGQWFEEERLRLGRRILLSNPSLPVLRLYARRGIPSALRPIVWTRLLSKHTILTPEHASVSLNGGISGWGCLSTAVASGSNTLRSHLAIAAASSGSGNEDLRLLSGKFASIATSKNKTPGGAPSSAPPIAMFSDVMLSPSLSDREKSYFRMLVRDVQRRELLVDDFVRIDISVLGDDPDMFVFEEDVELVLLSFERDRQVPFLLKSKPTFSVGRRRDGSRAQDMVYPPSGIVPFRGMSFLAAPFFFLFPSLDLCYFAFRESYCALFSRSQIISGRTTCSTAEDDSAVGLAKLFEDLLSSCEPVLYLHLMKLGVDPLEIALPWLFTSFAGYLSVDQLLILWDRLVAYDSLHLAAVLAVSIFIFRSEFLMLAENADMIRESFRNLTHVEVIPLLQAFLFSRSELVEEENSPRSDDSQSGRSSPSSVGSGPLSIR